jgi:hypothetical protein
MDVLVQHAVRFVALGVHVLAQQQMPVATSGSSSSCEHGYRSSLRKVTIASKKSTTAAPIVRTASAAASG